MKPGSERRETGQPPPQSVLVYVGGDLLGDGLMKIPFLRALRQAFPAARITWLAGKHASAYAHALRPLVAGLLDEVIERAGFDRPLRLLIRRPLPERRFDLVIDTQRGVLTTLVLRRVRHRRFVSGAADFRLSDVRPPRGYARPEAMIRQMLDLIELASGTPARPEAALAIDPEMCAAAARALADGPVHVGLAPGAGGRHKCWPLANFIALARAQAARGRVPVFILGPQEAGWTERLAAAVPQAVLPASDAAAGAPVSSSAAFTIAVARRLACAVANDSGAGHLIAAADVPLISLFGPTRPAKFAPAARTLEVVEAQAFGADDMAAIPVAAVEDAIERALAKDSARPAG